jgi:hypothetical protein
MPFDFSWMLGRALSEVVFLAPASWSFRFGTGVEIRADCGWRLIEGGHIVLSSEDHGQQYGHPSPVDAEFRCRSRIVDLKIQSVAVREDTRDIVILFESDARLEIVPLSSGYESWEIAAPDGTQTIAQGGGNLVTWK